MELSDEGLQFIIGWEGKRNHLYDDGGVGQGNCTIGYGHLVHYQPCDGRPSEAPFVGGLTDEQCIELLRTDLAWRVAAVNKLLSVTVTQSQFDMLVDLYFNAGEIDAVFHAVNTGGDVCAELMKIVHDGDGNVLDALKRRREAECEAFKEEDEMKPFLAWCVQQSAMYFVGPSGAKWITDAVVVNELENVFGKCNVTLSPAALNAIGVR